jgi:hypothetical protein
MIHKKQIAILFLIFLNLFIGAFLLFKYFEYRDYLIAQKAKESLRSIFNPILSPGAQKESKDLDALRERARTESLRK